ncbi:Uncharacterized protein PHSC3_001831 [Chlamydiales bacterium STE3]|nr:Uncharacterized protein PHSC3_001831 [Chlamydiales bacterium STE3]
MERLQKSKKQKSLIKTKPLIKTYKAPFMKSLEEQNKELQNYLNHHIPICQAMEIAVEKASSTEVILAAPFAKNFNHQQTIFGGSLHAVATLACWTMLYVNLQMIKDRSFQIVITESHVSYKAPVGGDFKAACSKPELEEWQRFLKTLHKKNKARIHLTATIHYQGLLCVDYQGTFAAL